MEGVCVRIVYNAYIIHLGDTYILCACLGWKFQLEYQKYKINSWYVIYLLANATVVYRLPKKQQEMQEKMKIFWYM